MDNKRRLTYLDCIYQTNLMNGDIIKVFDQYQNEVCPEKNARAKRILIYIGQIIPASWRIFTPFMELAKEPDFDIAVTNFYPKVKDGKSDDVDWADTLYFQRCVSPEVYAFARYAKQKGKKIIYDTDDLMFGIPANHPHWEAVVIKEQYPIWEEKMIEISDLVTVSTEYLRKAYQVRFPQAKVTTLPNCVHPGNWSGDAVQRDTINLGWAGGAAHFDDLKMLNPVLNKLFDDDSSLRLVTLNYSGWETKPYRDAFQDIDFSRRLHIGGVFPHREGQNYNMIDIGLAPLQLNDFNRAKSNVKYLAYSMSGIPTVATDIEPYQQDRMDMHLVNGNRFNNWLATLKAVIEEVKFSRSWEAQAWLRGQIAEQYGIEHNIDKWKKALSQ